MSRVVVITGSTSGIGRSAARCCLELGASVVVSSERPTALAASLTEFASLGGEAMGRVCDVRERDDVVALLQHSIDRFGRVDCWINNAGTTAPSGDTADVPFRYADAVIDTNIIGAYNGSVVALRHFRDRGAGRLINVVGRGEKHPVPHSSLYGSSKAWLRNFTLALAREERSHGIEVGTYNPGLVLTELTEHPRVLRGHERRQLKGLRTVMPILGNTANDAGMTLADLAMQPSRLRRRNRHQPLAGEPLRRLLTGRRAPIDVERITPNIIEPER